MSNKVRIVADSACDLSPELIEEYGIDIIPMNVNIGDKSYKDGIDLMPDDIYAKYRETGILPKTAAINPEQYREEYKKRTADGSDLVYISISSGFSSNYQSCAIAAEDFDNVYCVDSKNLSTGIGHLVLLGAEMAREGLEAKVIAERLTASVQNVRASFILDTLEFLHKGGRCSSVAALGANLLKLKPCIEVVDGGMIVGKKYRGKLDAVLKQYTIDKLTSGEKIVPKRIFITHSGISKEIEDMVKATVEETMKFDEILITRAGSTVSSHCGPNTLGVLFMVE